MTRILTALLLLLLASPASAQDAPRTPADALATIEAGVAELRQLLTLPPPPPPPAVPVITTADELRKALRDCGTYQLEPGSYMGPFTASGCPDVATVIRGAATTGARVVAGATSSYRITFQPPSGNTYDPATYHPLRVTGSHITFSGITIERGLINMATVLVGSPYATEPAAQPDDVTFDSVEVLAPPSTGGKRGFELHSRGFTLTHSLVTGFWFQGADSQAVLAINGPGPYNIIDNDLEASGENVMFGGGTIKAASMVPGGIVVRGNLLFKPQEWRQKPGSVKNILEFKAANGALVEDNVLDGVWRDGQNGDAIPLTPRNQNNDSPWTVVQDVVIRRNVIRNQLDGYAVNILGKDNNAPSLQTARITIEWNLFQDATKGIQILQGVGDWLKVTNNTMPAIKWAVIAFEGTAVKTPLTFTANVVRAGAYGLQGQLATGVNALTVYTVNPNVTGNVIELPVRTVWPSANTLIVAPATLAPSLDAGFHYLPDRSLGW